MPAFGCSTPIAANVGSPTAGSRLAVGFGGSGNTGEGFSSVQLRTQERREQVVTIAKHQLGTPYRAGGNTPGGFDCSGLVVYVFRQVGVQLPRTAADQFASMIPTRFPEPGDLVFFEIVEGSISHVGIYVGSETFIHAPRPGRTVEYADMRIPHWQNTYRGARRAI